MRQGAYRSLVEALLAAPADRVFITFSKGEGEAATVTFGEFTEQAAQQAHRLQVEGTQPGDTVVLVMPQSIELMATFMGAMMLGAVPAIVASPTFKVEPRKYRTGLAGVTANLRARLVMVDQGFPKDLLGSVALDGGTRVLFSQPFEAGGRAQAISPGVFQPRAFIQHSGGTTGLQKAVAFEHEPVLRQLAHLCEALRLEPGDRLYSWLPLYHDMGLIACFILPMVFHLPVVMQSPTAWVMAPHTALELIGKHRCTLAWMPNFALQFLARRVPAAARGRYDLSSLRLLINCAEPVRAASMDELRTAYAASGLRPSALTSSYALAENVFAVTQSRPDSPTGPRRLWVDGARLREQHLAAPVGPNAPSALCLVSSGQCISGNRVRIASTAGQAMPDGNVGEITIASDSLFAGYFHRPELTEKTLSDGWFSTGDLGFLWEGELFVVGRSKDLIIIAGRNIYPHDVEEVVCGHSAIHDGRCVALGLSNKALGTEQLFVVAEAETEGDLQRAMAVGQEVGRAVQNELGVSLRQLFLKPRGWLVKSTAGKPARSTTRKKLLAEHPELHLPLEDWEASDGGRNAADA